MALRVLATICAAAACLLSAARADITLPMTNWMFTADSYQDANNAPINVADGNELTIWHTAWTDANGNGINNPLPHYITINMITPTTITGLTYLPRPATTGSNGNIKDYDVYVSQNNVDWTTKVASGTFLSTVKTYLVSFPAVTAQYVRLVARTSINGQQFTSAAEITVTGPGTGPTPPPPTDPVLPRRRFSVAADSQEMVNQVAPASNVLDGDLGSIWHTVWSVNPAPPHPHQITISLGGAVYAVSGLTYRPRLDGVKNGNIGSYEIYLSPDGASGWTLVASGTWANDLTLKTVTFPAQNAMAARLVAKSDANDPNSPYTSASEINLLGVLVTPAPVDGTKGRWTDAFDLPVIPVAVALLPDLTVLMWSSYTFDTFGGPNGFTISAIYNPADGSVTERNVTETGHDMFCPGITQLANGDVVVTGGDNAEKTSIYSFADKKWTAGPNMWVPRGYQSSVLTANNKVFTIGGSWSGGFGGKVGELYTPSPPYWTKLTNAPATPILTQDLAGIYRSDNHAWLFGWTGNTVFHAGPSRQMNFFTYANSGGYRSAGNRNDDLDAMNGNAVMFAEGKILTVGGATSYSDSYARASAYVITLTKTTTPTVKSVIKVGPMANARAYCNSVALPDGKVLVTGGQGYAVPFTDTTAVFEAELFDPLTNKFTTLSAAYIPRTYHSVALLLPDGRVFTGGGGLCGAGCAQNHFDAEIFSPPYLLNADGSNAPRPTISVANTNNVAITTAKVGAYLKVTGSEALKIISIIRHGSATHAVDTDQRRLELCGPLSAACSASAGTFTYTVRVPNNPGIAIQGYYMVFGVNSAGVPSVSKQLRITV